MADTILHRALAELDSQIRSPEDLGQLRFILFDILKTEENSALKYFDKLQNQEKITVSDVTIIYEILFLMKKNEFWTRFKTTLFDGGVSDFNFTYNVKMQSKHFTDFRLMMLEIADNFTSCTSKLNRLKSMYEIPGDVTGNWMSLIYLEDKLKVNKDQQESLLQFAWNLSSADCPQGQRAINEYVTRKFEVVENPAAEENISIKQEPTNRPKIRRASSFKSHLQLLRTRAKHKQDEIEKMKINVEHSARECEEFIKNTETELIKQIEVSISKQLERLDGQTLANLEELERLESEVSTNLQRIEELNRWQGQSKTSMAAEFKKVEDHLRAVYPMNVGQFKCNPINTSSDLDRLMAMSNIFIVDRPIDVGKCRINSHELNNKCFGLHEKISLEVCLKNAYGNDVNEEYEKAPVTVNVEGPTTSNDYDVHESVSENIHKFELKFPHPGLWKLKVYVCGKVIPDVLTIVIASNDESLESTISLKNTEYFGGHIFDVCFMPDGKTLLACNFTYKIFSFNLSDSTKYSSSNALASGSQSPDVDVFATLNQSRRISSLCCPFVDHVYMTDNDDKEVICLDDKGNIRNKFGKGDFKYGSLEGIAATRSGGVVHVFVSNTYEHCVNHYKGHMLIRKIDTPVGSEAKEYRPWFLAINTNLQLYIANNYGDSIYICDINDDYQYVQHSMFCHYAVCIDENDNVILGCKSELRLFDKHLRFVRAIVESSTFGLAAHTGRLAAVCPGVIKIFDLS